MPHSTKRFPRSLPLVAALVLASGCDMSFAPDFGSFDGCYTYCGDGTGYTPPPFEWLPTPVAGGLVFTSIAAGANHSCGITSTGTWCWGERDLGTTLYQTLPAPQAVTDAQGITAISAGNALTCGTRPDGRALCWGLNSAGETGIGEIGPSWTPTPVKTSITFASVSTSGAKQYGRPHACGLTTEGAAFCWGDNYFGQLGDGTTRASLVPVRVSGNRLFESITVGSQFTCGIARGGDAYCWGQGSDGQLGDAPLKVGNCGAPGSGALLPCSVTPRLVPGGVKFSSLTAGSAFACGLDTGGRAYCWGANHFGQLGDGTSFWRFAPTRIADAPTFTSIEAGGSSACALTAGHDVMCWGNNMLGQLGDGTTQIRYHPAKVSSSAAFMAISVGDDHACALTAGGAGYCWGSNEAMKLGKGS